MNQTEFEDEIPESSSDKADRLWDNGGEERAMEEYYDHKYGDNHDN